MLHPEGPRRLAANLDLNGVLSIWDHAVQDEPSLRRIGGILHNSKGQTAAKNHRRLPAATLRRRSGKEADFFGRTGHQPQGSIVGLGSVRKYKRVRPVTDPRPHKFAGHVAWPAEDRKVARKPGVTRGNAFRRGAGASATADGQRRQCRRDNSSEAGEVTSEPRSDSHPASTEWRVSG